MGWLTSSSISSTSSNITGSDAQGQRGNEVSSTLHGCNTTVFRPLDARVYIPHQPLLRCEVHLWRLINMGNDRIARCVERQENDKTFLVTRTRP
jgi:hypothetical protein